jgi:extracellular solute-binding protein
MPAAGAKSLKVLSAGSALYGLRPAAEMFARDAGVAVQVATDHGDNIHRAAMRGEADTDVVALPADMIAALAAAGLADRETTVAIGAVRIGAAVRADAPRPDVATMAALRRALLAADAVLLTLAPTGEHLMRVIARLGLANAIAGKLVRFETSTLLNVIWSKARERARSASAPRPKSTPGAGRASPMPAPFRTRSRLYCPMQRPCSCARRPARLRASVSSRVAWSRGNGRALPARRAGAGCHPAPGQCLVSMQRG